MNFALLNNQLTEEKDLRLTNKNRGFLYGDGFFETIKIFNKKPFNLENHFDRIIYSADLLDIKFTLSVLDLNKSISILIEKNNIKSGSVRISVYRNSKGKYFPVENTSSILINSRNDINDVFVERSFINIGYYKENLKYLLPQGADRRCSEICSELLWRIIRSNNELEWSENFEYLYWTAPKNRNGKEDYSPQTETKTSCKYGY